MEKPPIDLQAHADAICEAHATAEDSHSQYVLHAIKAGQLLLEVKASLCHGAFCDWLLVNVKIGATTARSYMRLARLDEEERQHVADLPLRKALKSIAKPTSRSAPEPPSLVGKYAAAADAKTVTLNIVHKPANTPADADGTGALERRISLGFGKPADMDAASVLMLLDRIKRSELTMPDLFVDDARRSLDRIGRQTRKPKSASSAASIAIANAASQ